MGCGRAGDGVGAGADALIVIYTVIMESCANGACLLLTYAVRPGTSAGMHARTRPARLRLDALAASALTVISPCHWVSENFVVSILRMPSFPTFEGPRAQCLEPSHPDTETEQRCRALEPQPSAMHTVVRKCPQRRRGTGGKARPRKTGICCCHTRGWSSPRECRLRRLRLAPVAFPLQRHRRAARRRLGVASLPGVRLQTGTRHLCPGGPRAHHASRRG
jgi:hypothetical protein